MGRTSIAIIIGLAIHAAAWAQESLHIGKLFDGRYNRQKNTIEVLVKGKKLKPYNLTLFRSLTIKGDSAERNRVEQLVLQDATGAVDKETGKIGGHLYYGFFRYPQKDGVFRYLFFKNSALRKSEEPEVSIVYMEGYATLEELKEMFK